MNVVFLQGRLSSDPVLRELSSGSRLLSLEVSTTTDAGTANVPVAWFLYSVAGLRSSCTTSA